MIRRIIEIDQDKCNGCGACAAACHEGAIAMVNGKAKLMRDDYCDGLGDCLPTCPTGAITFVEREAAAYDEAAVLAAKAKKQAASPCGCPGSGARAIQRQNVPSAPAAPQSQLRQWPVQQYGPVLPRDDAHRQCLQPRTGKCLRKQTAGWNHTQHTPVAVEIVPDHLD